MAWGQDESDVTRCHVQVIKLTALVTEITIPTWVLRVFGEDYLFGKINSENTLIWNFMFSFEIQIYPIRRDTLAGRRKIAKQFFLCDVLYICSLIISMSSLAFLSFQMLDAERMIQL